MCEARTTETYCSAFKESAIFSSGLLTLASLIPDELFLASMSLRAPALVLGGEAISPNIGLLLQDSQRHNHSSPLNGLSRIDIVPISTQGSVRPKTTLRIGSSKFQKVWRRVELSFAHGFRGLCFAQGAQSFHGFGGTKQEEGFMEAPISFVQAGGVWFWRIAN